MHPTPRIQSFTLGPFQTNCYVVSVATDTHPNPCWIIDASFDPQELIDAVTAANLAPEALILTHAHIDHIAGVRNVLAAFPKIPILIHEAERAWLTDASLNLSAQYGMPVTTPPPSRTLKHGELLTLAGTTWEVRHTPGHSPGGIALIHQASRQALVGDALFAGSIGRTDFPGCSHDALIASIQTQLYTLPDDTTVFPGHGPSTTIGREKRTNPYVRAAR